MSISPSRVVGRILVQVEDWPDGASESRRFHGEAFRSAHEAPLLEIAWAARSGFPTLLHFWAHGLRRFLARQGAAQQFLGAGSYSICEQVSGSAFGAALARHRESLRDPGCWPLAGEEWLTGYRMIESACRVSYAGESAASFLAFYWSHGSVDAGVERLDLALRAGSVLPPRVGGSLAE